MAPLSSWLWVGGLQWRAAWWRDGKVPSEAGRQAISSSDTPAPPSWRASASLCRHGHAKGQQRQSWAPVPGPGPAAGTQAHPWQLCLRPSLTSAPESDVASSPPPSSRPSALTWPHPKGALPSASAGFALPSAPRTRLPLQEAFLDFLKQLTEPWSSSCCKDHVPHLCLTGAVGGD